MLDEFIRRYYRELSLYAEHNAKLGDLIKMIESRQKQSPVESDRTAFWKMLEDIRRENLRTVESDSKSDSTQTGGQKSKGRRAKS